jgi:predicted DCC family thiol-disulfide oxidoreductase YuxK
MDFDGRWLFVQRLHEAAESVLARWERFFPRSGESSRAANHHASLVTGNAPDKSPLGDLERPDSRTDFCAAGVVPQSTPLDLDRYGRLARWTLGPGKLFRFNCRYASDAFLYVRPGMDLQKNTDHLEWILYDGTCALCHGWVRFVLGEDTDGKAFRISPLQGELFATRFPAEKRANVADSLVVVTQNERLLTRSAAVLHVLRRLGGLWRIIAAALAVVPRPALDWCYDRVGSIRKQLFGTRLDLCPVLSFELRRRFDR